MGFWKRRLGTSIGCKAVMAVTGGLLLLFVIAHLLGNLLIYKGPDALNSYAAWLKSLGLGLWAARAGLLAVFLLHVAAAIRLHRINRAARPEPYRFEAIVQVDPAERLRVRAAVYMFLTGLVVLAFVVYHLAHFTFGWIMPKAFASLDHTVSPARHDVYTMVIQGFRNPVITVSYVVAMLVLGAHLAHGVLSMFQTLGCNHPNVNAIIRVGGVALVLLIVLGNCLMPVSVLLGWVAPAGPVGT